jgi:porin
MRRRGPYPGRRRVDRAALRGAHGAAPSAISLAVALVALAANPAHAQGGSNLAPAEVVAPRAEPPGVVEPSISSSIPALGDFKQALLARGVNFQLSYIQDTLGNVTGGVQQGATYNCALYMLIDADLAKLAGLPSATFRVNAFQIQGRGLSINNVFNYSTISSIEALPTTRLVELWIEQKLFADMASIRVGQLAADNQFFVSPAYTSTGHSAGRPCLRRTFRAAAQAIPWRRPAPASK